MLKNLSNQGIIKEKEERIKADEMIDMLSIKTNSAETTIQLLSGGNQQKCIMARLIAADSKILILDEATQGIDVEAKSQIYFIMDELAKAGKAILFISSDLSEVIGISDRILIMRHGHIVRITDGKEAQRMKVLWDATVGSED